MFYLNFVLIQVLINKELMTQELRRANPHMARRGLFEPRPYFTRLSIDDDDLIRVKFAHLPSGRKMTDMANVRKGQK